MRHTKPEEVDIEKKRKYKNMDLYCEEKHIRKQVKRNVSMLIKVFFYTFAGDVVINRCGKKVPLSRSPDECHVTPNTRS